MKTIIVPVDFSEHSENALKAAASLSRKNNAAIIAVHMMGLSDAVLTKSSASDLEGMFYAQLTQKRFQEFLDKDYLEGLNVSHTVKNFTVFSELDEVAQEHNADLIVMGSHGNSGLSELFVGSNTEKVVRSSETPVLVIKASTDFNVQTAIFACDYKSESIPAFTKTMRLFNVLNIEPHLVYINLAGDGFLSTSEIDTRIKYFILQLNDAAVKASDITIYADYTVENGVFNYAAKMNADLIALPTHGRRGMAHFFSGSIGEDIVNHSTLPVLTVKI
jgi:nucleotide-binding universal stress UspA family protein